MPQETRKHRRQLRVYPMQRPSAENWLAEGQAPQAGQRLQGGWEGTQAAVPEQFVVVLWWCGAIDQQEGGEPRQPPQLAGIARNNIPVDLKILQGWGMRWRLQSAI